MTIPPGPPGPPGPQDRSPESDVTASAPTCFRHPGRETYVSCVRCGRPACPDCLRSAAVGQQCVECIREGSRGTRRATAPFGGKVTNRPVVTWTLIALNVFVYLLELINPDKAVHYGGMIGGAFDPVLNERVGVVFGDWYRLLSSAFLHEPLSTGFGIFHIAFNMWALYVVGPPLEQMLGRLRFILRGDLRAIRRVVHSVAAAAARRQDGRHPDRGQLGAQLHRGGYRLAGSCWWAHRWRSAGRRLCLRPAG